MAGLHGLAAPWPPQVAPGTCPVLPARPLACTLRDGAREPCERRGCEAALHAAASGRRAAPTLLLLADEVGPSAAAGAAVQRPAAVASAHRALRRPTWQPSASALRRHNSSLYACGDTVSGCTRARDGTDARPVQHGGSQSELVSVNKWSDGMYMHTTHARAPHKRTSFEAPLRAAEWLVATEVLRAETACRRVVDWMIKRIAGFVLCQHHLVFLLDFHRSTAQRVSGWSRLNAFCIARGWRLGSD